MSIDLPAGGNAGDSAGDGAVTILTDAGLGEGAGAYAVRLPVFEGPLDLLLHLIRQNEVEITDIPIALVAKQYLDYLELMRELNIDVVGEYLVMAATLALIKSRMLLPPTDEEEEGEALDPRAELVARLLEYQRYKEVAEALSTRRLLGRDVFEARGAEPRRVPDAQREIEVGLFELIEAFRQVLDGVNDDDVHEVELEQEEVTVRERMLAVMELIEGVDSIEFHRIFEQEGVETTRPMLVATFLAILELARLAALRLYQGVGEAGDPEGPIRLRAVPPEGAGSMHWRERISQLM